MPLVALCFGVSTLALAGMPPLAGFASKDAILTHLLALSRDNTQALGPVAQVMFFTGVATAGLTAFYMGRCVLLTFFGNFRGPASVGQHVHDASFVMALPLLVLAALSLIGGFLSWPEVLGGHDRLVGMLEHVTTALPAPVARLSHQTEYLSMALSVGVALSGLIVAWWVCRREAKFSAPERLWRTGFQKSAGVDALYQFVWVRPYRAMAERLLPRYIEHALVAGAVRFISRLTQLLSFTLQLLHSGNLQRGLAVLLLALAVMLYGWLLPIRPFAATSPPADVGGAREWVKQ